MRLKRRKRRGLRKERERGEIEGNMENKTEHK